ncbi:hypothetical protein Taro_018061 [Colocasia esculenta]|uniref:RRM domain-containing protein n=1 Tax=Colocasia esculenta TaxID=4460 RepID=A0A843USU5_COLES|nr:hypothetical protein [Colocasia esculenta]
MAHIRQKPFWGSFPLLDPDPSGGCPFPPLPPGTAACERAALRVSRSERCFSPTFPPPPEELGARVPARMARLYVGNLDSRVTERELEDEFRGFGVLRSVWVARKPPGYAFVDFDDRRDALDAIRELDGLGSGRRRSPSPRYRRSPSYGRSRSYSPRDRSPKRRSVSPRRRSYSRSRSPAYKRDRDESPYANGCPA